MSIETHKTHLRHAISLSKEGMENGSGGPFGAVIVKEGKVVGKGSNSVTSTNDPTAHAEVVAIRDACKNLGSFQLEGCIIYSSCEPCPMCLGAIYWARPDKLIYACTAEDAASVGFDDSFIYKEISLPKEERSLPSEQMLGDEALDIMKLWNTKEGKIDY